jgi:hypothetical protein
LRAATVLQQLRITGFAGTVAAMKSIPRFLQMVGLTIPPLIMIAQLAGRITAGQMLLFLVAAVCFFSVGYLLQAYGGKGR